MDKKLIESFLFPSREISFKFMILNVFDSEQKNFLILSLGMNKRTTIITTE